MRLKRFIPWPFRGGGSASSEHYDAVFSAITWRLPKGAIVPHRTSPRRTVNLMRLIDQYSHGWLNGIRSGGVESGSLQP